jgi:large repetitive protein
VDDGWASADVGGRYSTRGTAADFYVREGSGRMLLPSAGSGRTVFLPEVAVRDLDLKFSVSFDRLPEGGNLFIYGVARRTDTGAAYRPKIHIVPDGTIFAHVGALLPSGERSLGRQVLVADARAEAGQQIWVRMHTRDSDPTFIGVRVWADGQAEPNYWQFAVIDWTGVLQGTGFTGLAAYLGRRTIQGSIEIAFNDLLATSTDLQSE